MRTGWNALSVIACLVMLLPLALYAVLGAWSDPRRDLR